MVAGERVLGCHRDTVRSVVLDTASGNRLLVVSGLELWCPVTHMAYSSYDGSMRWKKANSGHNVIGRCLITLSAVSWTQQLPNMKPSMHMPRC